jgi:anti-sigma-K factor RskA
MILPAVAVIVALAVAVAVFFSNILNYQPNLFQI